MKQIKRIVILVFLVCFFGSALEGLAQTESVSSYDHVVIVLDASGSMDGHMADGTRKINAAKKALKEVTKTIPPTTRIGLLVFSAGNISDDWVYSLGVLDQKRLMEAIELPKPSGSTPLGTYMKIGADRLLQERETRFNYGTYRLLIVTDGEAGDQGYVESYTPLIIARGIKIDVIGVAMSQDHTLATKVHTYRRADDPKSLQTALREVLGEVSSANRNTATGEDAFVLIEPLPIEVASAAITALSVMENHPIGEQRPVKPVVDAQSSPDNPPVLIIAVIIILVVLVVLFIVTIS